MDRYNEIKEFALSLGVDFFGAADLESFKADENIQVGLLAGFTRAISLGAALSREVIDDLVDRPTPHYSHHYQTVNNLLDQAALRVSGFIQRRGFRALPVPASQILDWENWLGAISHKAVARMAGLGWQGKSLLLINPEVGPRIRLVTVLTDLNLPPDQPLANRCGKCRECEQACPAGAILGRPFGDGYRARSEAWNVEACVEHLTNKFGQLNGVTALICGLCIKACPFGRRGKPYGEASCGPASSRVSA
ncbi:MAG: 4Fe-4S double cluster binding domain-containing protein [Pseudomonadota bacterium]